MNEIAKGLIQKEIFETLVGIAFLIFMAIVISLYVGVSMLRENLEKKKGDKNEKSKSKDNL